MPPVLSAADAAWRVLSGAGATWRLRSAAACACFNHALATLWWSLGQDRKGPSILLGGVLLSIRRVRVAGSDPELRLGDFPWGGLFRWTNRITPRYLNLRVCA